jgi:hypothetical protein
MQSKIFVIAKARRAISLIEVMVSILVALIGVFGVFVLIPFAVRQVEIGMNEDAAQTLARNAVSNFETQGFQEIVPTTPPTLRWAVPDTLVAGAPFYNAADQKVTTDKFYCIDPWGMALRLAPGVDPQTFAPQAFLQFPFFVPSAPTVLPSIPRISLFDRLGNAFSPANARRLFAGHDDLVVKAPTDDFSGPAQEFFTPNGGRQYSGRLSWQMFVHQEHDNDDYAHFYAAVSLKRVPDVQDRVFNLTRPGAIGSDVVLSAGGDVELTEINGTQPLDSTLVRRGLWMVLIAYDPAGPPGTNIADIGFFRVLESDLTSPVGSLPRVYNVTLQGGDFRIPANFQAVAVLMPSVIGVYERTMKFETPSEWNTR